MDTTDHKPGFWDRVGEYNLGRLMLYVFLFALSERLIVTLVFMLRWGWHTVSGIELWFYYGVAKGTFELYSAFDPSWWILSTLGAIFSGQALLYSVYLASSLSSSLNAALFCLLVSELHGKKTGFLAGLIYGSMVLPMFNSAGTVTHDIFAYPYLVLSVYGAAALVKRKGWMKLPFAGIMVAALFLGRQVGPTIYVGAGTIAIFFLWQAVAALLGKETLPRILALILTPLLALAAVYGGGTFIFGEVSALTLVITVLAVGLFLGIWEVVRLWVRKGNSGLLLALLAFFFLILGWSLLGYGVLGTDLDAATGWGWLIVLAATAAVTYFLHRFQRLETDLGHLSLLIFLVILATLVVLLNFEIIPPMMEKTYDLALAERGIDVRAQIKAGSGDLLASSLGDYWLRFNFLFFFLPAGLWIAFRKKDVLGWALLLSGFLMSLSADRGTRPLTFGFALMGALAFVNWRTVYNWIPTAWMCFIIGIFGGKYSTEYAVFFPAAALFIFYSVQGTKRSASSALARWAVYLIAGILSVIFIFLAFPGLRDWLGLFSLKRLPGGLLATAAGWNVLFLFFALAVSAGAIYLGITRGRKLCWIWALVFLTVLWAVIGAVFGGAAFEAKQLAQPGALQLRQEIKSLPRQTQIAALGAIRTAVESYVKAIRRYWTIQVCLLIPGLLIILDCWTRRIREKTVRKRVNALLGKYFLGAVPLLLILLLALGTESFWKHLYLIFPPLAGILVIILIVGYRRDDRPRGQFLTGVALVCWIFATVIPSMNQTAKSTEAEYRVYKWLDENVPPDGDIFVPWSDGYMAEAISGLSSRLHPANIDFRLPRIYWMPEAAAARALKSAGLDYILVSTKYFKLMQYNRQTGEFQYSFSPDIIYQPQQAGIKTLDQLKETALFKLLYARRFQPPVELTKFRLIHGEIDRKANEAYMVYEILD